MARSAGYKILVVEDDDDWTDIIGLWLKTSGYFQVRFASSGAQALKLLKTYTPDCITLDLQLSDQDGSMLCRRIRSLPNTAKVPVVMLTNYAGEKVTCLKAGADYFVGKNPNGLELLATLEALFRRRDMDAGLKRLGDLAFEADHCEVYHDGELAAALTPKTFELFLTLVERAPSPVDRKDLFHLIEKREGAALSRALDILVNRLRKTLPERLRRRIRSVRGFGYTYIPPSVGKPPSL
ncbi:MAG: response regulator transcription factor [Elusimicrobiota bacterium]